MLFCFIIILECLFRFLFVFPSVLKISSASFCGATSVILKGGKVDTKPHVNFLPMPRCDEQDFCSLSANLDDLALEDPCPKTEKYLEAQGDVSTSTCKLHSLTVNPSLSVNASLGMKLY